jgi:hypothetical protein
MVENRVSGKAFIDADAKLRFNPHAKSGASRGNPVFTHRNFRSAPVTKARYELRLLR